MITSSVVLDIWKSIHVFTAKRQRAPFQTHPPTHNVNMTFCLVTWVGRPPLVGRFRNFNKLSKKINKTLTRRKEAGVSQRDLNISMIYKLKKTNEKWKTVKKFIERDSRIASLSQGQYGAREQENKQNVEYFSETLTVFSTQRSRRSSHITYEGSQEIIVSSTKD